MARKFEFRNNNLELDIAGNKFELDTTDVEVVARVQKFGKEAQEIGKKLADKGDFAEALEETIQFCLDSIDSILGEGSSKEIFAGRKVGLFDCLDVIEYITTEVNESRSTKFQAYGPSRAQQRAQK